MQKHKLTAKKVLLFTVVFYLVYAVLTAVVPAMLRKPVSPEFAASVSPSDFFGERESVDRAALVEFPQESLDARLHMLDEARERIDVSYYAMHMGETTDLFLGALLHAADRGVSIRIVVDAQFGGLTRSHGAYAAALGAHPNVELKVYNPPHLLKPWTWNGRLHDKYIIIDDRLLLLGGRNIGDKYFGPEGYEKQLSLDRDVLVYNTAWESQGDASVLFRVREYMDQIWNGPDSHTVFQKDTKKGREMRLSLQKGYARFCAENPTLFDHAEDNYMEWTYPASRISFVHNDVNIGVKEPKAGHILGQLLLQARESAVLQSPYVILDPMLEKLLEQLGEKGIDGKILTNSPGSSPNPVACTAYSGDRKAILKSGVSLWEYQGDDSIHAKSYVIDDRMTIIGSYNLDPRSAYLDTELLLVIDSPEFTKHFQQVQGTYFQQSLPVGPQGDYLPGGEIEALPVPLWKRILIGVLYFPVKLFKYLA